MSVTDAEASERRNKMTLFEMDRACYQEVCETIAKHYELTVPEIVRAFIVLESFDKVLALIRHSIATEDSFNKCLKDAGDILKHKKNAKK